ncbi:MAG: S9 family peptidase [Bacteroidales bacterium]|jgi:oligopeptidase B|nr:S9 family peptidase [Bacteroidales bacterium]
MKRIGMLTMAVMMLILASCSNKSLQPPVAAKKPFVVESNGNERIDDYFWLRLSDEQKNAETPDSQTVEVVKYLTAEDDYATAVMKHTEALQQKLFDEIKGRIKEDDESVPYLNNGYYYQTRYFIGKEYPVYYRKKEGVDSAQVLLDVNVIAEGQKYTSVGGLSVSPDNNLMAYAVDHISRRQYTMLFMNLNSGELLGDRIENVTGEAVWANDNKTVFYVTKDPETLRAAKVMKHVLGTPVSDDKLIYDETDETFAVGLGKTKSKKYITIVSNQTLTTEVRLIEADKPEGKAVVFEPRKIDHLYSVEHLNGKFYIHTNADGAKNFKLMSCPENKTGMANWTEVIPHRSDVLLENFEIFDNYLVADEMIEGLTNLRIISLADNSDHFLDFGEETYTAGISVNPNANTSLLRFSYSSLTTPNSVFDYDMAARTKTLLKQDSVLGGFDKNNYESKRLWATAADGTKVPVSLVYRKGFVQDGSAPMLLYSYGSYGSSTNPSFRSSIISLLDRGFVYALAHIRGGSEMGRQWYEDGKLLKKINTFTDFNDCARFLINEKYTSPENLYAMGGSAGGLLMGAIANMEPQLYNGIIAQVPFVDVVSTMLDATIPLTTFEWDEWGDPRKQEYYDYMLSYSPYDQVKEQDYPHMLVTTGYWDSQVQYWEPAKWVAKLRDKKTDDNILIMDVNMTAGHGGASGRFERLKTTALEFAFILDLEEIKE